MEINFNEDDKSFIIQLSQEDIDLIEWEEEMMDYLEDTNPELYDIDRELSYKHVMGEDS